MTFALLNPPIRYISDFIPLPHLAFAELWAGLAWRSIAGNRLEYYCNDFDRPYTYGQKEYARTYEPQPYHPLITMMREQLEDLTGHKFEVCFLNGYRDGKDQLGWHADDSPEMDDARPIGIISLGAEREIWFRGNDRKDDVAKLKLASGSLCLMDPGMQDTHQHRIPKSPVQNCPPRISLTFRGYVDLA